MKKSTYAMVIFLMILGFEGVAAGGIELLSAGAGFVLGSAVIGQAAYYSNYGNELGVTIYVPYSALLPRMPLFGVTYELNQSGNH